MGVGMPAHAHLRAATAGEHERVDKAFAGYDLAGPASYGAFLTAHARALPAVEAALAGADGLPPLRPRATLLAADLADLGLPRPDPLAIAGPRDLAEAFGMAYVLEGSRLGGGMLARGVPPALPRAYLTATHEPGEWRAFGQALDAAAGDDPAWLSRATEAAVGVFALYRRAAER